MKESLKLLLEEARVALMILEKIDKGAFSLTIERLTKSIRSVEHDYHRIYSQHSLDRRKNPR